MEKKEYIMCQLRRTRNKKYENYCITRIIHKLDRLDVQFNTQQVFKRPDGKLAYADLFFPQLNISVEIDETYHLAQKDADKQRTKDIEDADKKIRESYTGLEDIVLDKIEEHRISATEVDTLEEINKNIDEVVDIIKDKIEKMGENFIPWENVYSDASYYVEKGRINKNDNIRFRIIDDIAKLFNMDKAPEYEKRHVYVKVGDNEFLWCPTLKLNGDGISNNAENTISQKGDVIYEYFKKNNDEMVKEALNDSDIQKYVFAKYKGFSKGYSYKFIGVYMLDKNKTKEENVRVWIRVRDWIDLKKYNKIM